MTRLKLKLISEFEDDILEKKVNEFLEGRTLDQLNFFADGSVKYVIILYRDKEPEVKH